MAKALVGEGPESCHPGPSGQISRGAWIRRVLVFPYLAGIVHPHVRPVGRVDSFRFVVCDRADCRQVFFLCRRCDRGDRYCSRACAHQARHATLRAASRRYQQSRRGRGQHAARQAHYRRRRAPREKVTHQTSHAALACGIVTAPSVRTVTRTVAQEDPDDADASDPRRAVSLCCARCGRPGRWFRHTTLAHLRSRVGARR